MNSDAPSMLELHKQAMEDVAAAYHDFLLIYRKNSQCVYGFVEGKDDPSFYRDLILRELPDNWSAKLLPAGNRQKVIKTLNTFNWNDFDKDRIAFFLDRDLHDFLGDQLTIPTNVYITDGYSIENSILGERLLEGVLADVYQISLMHPDDEQTIKQIVQENNNVFFEAIMPLMGQILLWRRSGAKANLSNVKLDALFSFTQAKCTSIGRLALLQQASTLLSGDLSRRTTM